ncbi:hypothetical protein CS063_05100 [Sporanaerobium hydrogeniformans]|uniref:Uncharacterized protein n=1 Tax=Sporanaerobium hydrogeniformans TaxID=3072179 RepID=A0AC61DF31_9FIRM|nr:hypothetical protein [Sporanaerobium hydrogeniformans]PHV71428.1 hypothetical protein CS063_05100 [Sporanaerobium hydrogeniformans]
MKLIKKISVIALAGLLALPSLAASTTPAPSSAPTTQESIQSKPFVLDNFKVIATTLNRLGVSKEDLLTYIQEGKKLEDVLALRKISAKKFKKVVLNEYFKVVDEGVAMKQLSAEQAAQLKAAIQETVKGWLPKK